jgi:hypothetical protein
VTEEVGDICAFFVRRFTQRRNLSYELMANTAATTRISQYLQPELVFVNTVGANALHGTKLIIEACCSEATVFKTKNTALSV